MGRFSRIPNWVVNTDYVVGDLVAHDAKIYRCITAHTSDSTQWDDTEEAKWEELSPTINEISNWAVSTDYEIGQLVIHDNKLYRCNTAHTSDSTSFNTDIAYWDVIGSSGIDAWKTGELYQQGSMVVYNDKIYVCDSSHTSANPFDFTKWHEVSSTTIEDWQASTEYVENQPIEYNDTLFRANKDFISGTTVSDDDNNLDFVYANLSTWQSGVYYRQGAIVIDSDDKIYKCKQSHTSSSANRDTNWEELSKTLVEEYAQNKNYAEGAPVLYNGKLYRANTDVTNSTAVLDPNKWDNIVGSGIEQWQPSTDYSVGNVVVNNNQVYICTTAHTSDSTAFNTDIANWGLLDTKWKSENWSANTLYTANEVVLYDNRLFRCVSTHTSAVDFATDANYWLAIGSRLEVWKQNVHYKVEDVIINNNKLYRCIIEHTSTTTFDGTKWDEISSADIGLWQPSTDYKVGNVVIKDNHIYRCKTLHTSDSSDFYINIANWDILDTKWQAKDWVTNTYYLEGEVVLYEGTIYRCNTAHTSDSTFLLDASNWELVNANIKEWESAKVYKVGQIVEREGNLYKCLVANNSTAFRNSEWELVPKHCIESWRSYPDPNTLGLFHFEQESDIGYNSMENPNFVLQPNSGGFLVRSTNGKFGHGLEQSRNGMYTSTLDFTNGNEVYTVEFWFVVIGSSATGVNALNFLHVLPDVSWNSNGLNGDSWLTINGTTSSTLPRGQHHVAFVVTSTSIDVYFDGTLDMTCTRATGGASIYITDGTNTYWGPPKVCTDELRVSNVARYSSNFTPPIEPFTDPNFSGYKYNDLVVYEDKIYRALEDNNDVEFDYTKWREVSKSSGIPYWISGSNYENNTVVLYGKSLYRAVTNIINSTVNPAQSSDFQLLDTTVIKPYGTGQTYQQYEAVSYDGAIYVANSMILNSPSVFDSSDWTQIGGSGGYDLATTVDIDEMFT